MTRKTISKTYKKRVIVTKDIPKNKQRNGNTELTTTNDLKASRKGGGQFEEAEKEEEVR